MRRTTYLFVMGLAVVVMAAVLASSERIVSAQNTNSSTTMTAPEAKSTPTRRARRGRKKAATPADATPMDSTMAMPAAPEKKTYGRCDPTKEEQTDLSGTYTGKLKHGGDPVQDATLTITGNNFTATMGTETHSGRITAVTTCGYTAVTMMTGDMTPPDPTKPAPPPMPAMSLRAKKVGDSLTLTSVPGSREMVEFVSGNGTSGHAVRKHRTTRKPKGTPPPPPPAKQ